MVFVKRWEVPPFLMEETLSAVKINAVKINAVKINPNVRSMVLEKRG